jgi:uncharacterized membrane protein YeaQ/YmgE (transglycosylase-associated protein family)
MILALIIAMLSAGFVSGGLATIMCRRDERCFSINLLAGLIGAGGFAWLFYASGVGFRDFQMTLYFALVICMTGAMMAQFFLWMVRSANRKS